HRRWGATVGQFRVPYSLESLLSSPALETSERSRIVGAAKRDIGVQADWTLAGRVVLQAAVVNGEGPNRTTSTNPDNRMAYFARAVVTPLTGLDLGGAFEGYNDSTGANVQGMYRSGRWTARAEYIDEHNRTSQVHIRGWYGLAGYYAIPQRVELVGRVEQFDPSNLVATDRSTGYLIGVQYFMRGDNFKILADYEAFRGQALAMGRRGDADVGLSHAAEAGRVLVASGYFVRRRAVTRNEFLVVGPATDPAGLRGRSDAVAAFRRLAERRAPFVSRGDQSGTHQREQLLWKRTGMTAAPPRDGWYVESGQGMGATLQLADE